MGKSVIKVLCAELFIIVGYRAEAAMALKTDPSVSSGILDCGLSYYLVTNDSRIGTADFALVRKTSSPASRDRAAELEFSRACLDSLPHFTGRRPLEFLADNGVSYTRNGYITMEKGAVIYHFRDISLVRNDKITDSTLLMLFDLVLKSSSAPSADSLRENVGNQALIIAGDIDKDLMLRKMNMLSLMVDRNQAAMRQTPDTSEVPGVRQPDTLSVRIVADDAAGMASVNATFYGPEIPRQLRGTAVSLLSSQFWNEFRNAARSRISDRLMEEGIPFSQVNLYRYNTAESSEQEKYMASVGVSSGDTTRAAAVLQSVMADFRENGLTPEEYGYARDAASSDLYSRSVARSRENGSYVRKCADAFIYGSAIVSPHDEAEFFLTSGLPDSAGRRYLNAYIASLIPECGPSQEYESNPSFSMSDTLRLLSARQAVKVKKTRHNKVYDADVWYFANGMTVMYKKMPSDGIMHYSWVLRGGFGTVDDMKTGEGAFYPDMLFNGTVCGMKGTSLKRMLATEGISMDVETGISGTRIYGSAPFGRMTLLMKALLSISRTYAADDSLGRYYIGCERLRLSSAKGEYQSRLAAIDSIMNPGFRYSANKSLSGLYPDLPERAALFYNDLFSRSNDGMLVIVGDMDAYDVRKIMEDFLGGFMTSDAIARRPWISSQPVSGWSTYVSDGRANSMDVVLSARMPLSSVNYMSARIATMAVRDAVSKSLADYGMTARVSGSFSFFPHEGYSVSISVVPVKLSSLPSSVEHESYFTCLYSARAALSSLRKDGLTAGSVDMYRKILQNNYKSMQSDPEFWLWAMSRRVSTGKNLDTEYEKKIADVTTDSVNDAIRTLCGGSIVEYIIKKD